LEKKSKVDELKPEFIAVGKKSREPECVSLAWSGDGQTLFAGMCSSMLFLCVASYKTNKKPQVTPTTSSELGVSCQELKQSNSFLFLLSFFSAFFSLILFLPLYISQTNLPTIYHILSLTTMTRSSTISLFAQQKITKGKNIRRFIPGVRKK